MVVSKPTGQTIVSFILFLLIAYVFIGISSIQWYRDNDPPWYIYLILPALGPIALFLSFRMIFSYKVIQMGNNQIEVYYPATNRKTRFAARQVIYWKESIVKTGKSTKYKELEIKFENGRKVQMAEREYSNYKLMIGYLRKKLQKKERD